MTLLEIYKKLFSMYGPQGWWPLIELNNEKKINIAKSGSAKGYHPGDYSYPRNEHQRFEICIGAILTQNTAWPNVERALINLRNAKLLDVHDIAHKPIAQIAEQIKPAGYFNQKAIYLKAFAKFFMQLQGKTPSRESLLGVKGIGNETADSILLYAYTKPEFVVDAYTKRIFLHLGLISKKSTYMEIKELFEANLKKDYKLFQEFHALIVEHAKRHYSKKPYGENDFLN